MLWKIAAVAIAVISFSIFAHSSVEQTRSPALEAQVEQLTSSNKDLLDKVSTLEVQKNGYVADAQKNADDAKEAYNKGVADCLAKLNMKPSGVAASSLTLPAATTLPVVAQK